MEVMHQSITLHIYMVYILFTIMSVNMIAVIQLRPFMKLAKFLKFMTPLYHLSNAMVIYTGVIVSAYMRIFDWSTLLMIVTAIFIMILEIKRYKKMRIIKSNDTERQALFYAYAKRIYLIEMGTLILVYVIVRSF